MRRAVCTVLSLRRMLMMKSTKDEFINSAIECVAENGIEGTRTSIIAKKTNHSEAMIFQIFGNKAGLLQETFKHIDNTLCRIVIEAVSEEKSVTNSVVERAWGRVWDYLVSNPKVTFFLIRYRFSNLFPQKPFAWREGLKPEISSFVDAFNELFGEPPVADKMFLIEYCFEQTLLMAEKQITGRLSKAARTKTFVCRMIKRSLWN